MAVPQAHLPHSAGAKGVPKISANRLSSWKYGVGLECHLLILLKSKINSSSFKGIYWVHYCFRSTIPDTHFSFTKQNVSAKAFMCPTRNILLHPCKLGHVKESLEGPLTSSSRTQADFSSRLKVFPLIFRDHTCKANQKTTPQTYSFTSANPTSC